MVCIDCKRSVSDGALRCVPCQRWFEDDVPEEVCEDCGNPATAEMIRNDEVLCLSCRNALKGS